MSDIILTAEKVTEAIIADMSLTTELRTDPEDETGQQVQYQATFRVIIEQDAYNISSVTQPTASITQTASLVGRFNQSQSPVTIFPITSLFFLVNQVYTPLEVKGARMFKGRKEWVSVSPWTDLDWSG